MSILVNTNAYDYLNVLEKAADASWTRNELIAGNIANVDTPGYKRKDINFEATLEKAMGASRFTSTDDKIHSLKYSELNADVYVDSVALSYR
ncbi:MAG: flagellar basal body protein, partial [Lachnospiraceae bacterium]|nr:flagellar basal body protein [Lachnospiraceae bacterium]